MKMTKKQLDRFWNKVEKSDGCWNWRGHKNFGYGRLTINYKQYLAHKVSAYLSGKLHFRDLLKPTRGANGVVVMHKCDNRSCVNPEHLRVATQLENMRDAKKKGRKWNGEHLPGESNPRCKLSDIDVSMIRQEYADNGITQGKLASKYGVCRSYISQLINNKHRYTHEV